MGEDFENRLTAALARRLPRFEALLSCTRLTAGANQEMYRLEVRMDGETRQLALRRSSGQDCDDPATLGLPLDVEARLLTAVGSSGVPVPEVIAVLEPEDHLGSGYLMAWLTGETLGPRIVKSPDLADLRSGLAGECGRILAGIHAIDWRVHGLDSVLVRADPEALVREQWSLYRDMGIPQPMIDFTARWLLDHLPPPADTCLVHGDFRNGNLMVSPRGVVAVLDWELAHLGDPVRDLGWLCVNSWRFGRSDLPVGGFGDIDALLAGYAEVSGRRIELAHLRFWQVFGSYWWAVCCLRMARSWYAMETTSPERLAIGRRTSEAQMDCANLLIPGDFRPPPEAAGPALAEIAPVPDLLAGVEAFLRAEPIEGCSGARRYQLRVAANLLGTVRRELDVAPAARRHERRRLAALLGEDRELPELRAALATGLQADLPLSTPGLARHLRQTAADQLAIDQPGYSALTAPC